MALFQPADVGTQPLRFALLPEPVAGPTELRVRVTACGVCHTDLHTIEGELTLDHLPLVPGHQIVGIVDRVGDEVTEFAVGDRVGIGWLNATCGLCEACLRGSENLCPKARFTGLHRDGGYAQFTAIDARFAFALPPRLVDVAAAPLLCGGIIGYRSLRLSGIRPGGRLGLLGFGGSAHLTIQVARSWGCEVYVFTRSAPHRRHAEELGAVWTGTAEDTPPMPLDGAVTFAPAGEIIPQALRHLRPGGVLAINAIHMSPIPEMPYSLVYGERALRSVMNYTRRDAVEFLQLAADIPVVASTEIFSLREANDALQRLKAGAVRGTAVLVVD